MRYLLLALALLLPGQALAQTYGSERTCDARCDEDWQFKFGRTTDVDDNAVTIYGARNAALGPSRVILDTSPVTLYASSADPNEDESTLTVQGCDENWDALSVTVTLDGTNEVQLSDPNGWMRVNRAFVANDVGLRSTVIIHTDPNTSAGVPDDPNSEVRMALDNTANQTLHSVITVCDGHRMALKSFCGDVLKGSAVTANAWFFLYSLADGGVSRMQDLVAVSSGAANQGCHYYDPPRYFDARTTLEVVGQGTASNSDLDMAGTLNMRLVETVGDITRH